MTNANLTEIVCIIDRSSSMYSSTAETIDGFNDFVMEQRSIPGHAKMTVTLFNEKYEILYDGVVLDELPKRPLTKENYVTSGCTALLDAVGRTIDAVGNRLALMDEKHRPGKVIFLIMTDGYENASCDYDKRMISKMIERQKKKYDWKFVFMGANIDVFSGAKELNIGHSMTFHQTTGSVYDRANHSGMFMSGSLCVGQYRLTDSVVI